MNPVLKVENLQKFYKTKGTVTKAINHISFEVERGEYIGIMGASGSGKTTLLNCISTIDRPTAGKILISGRDVTNLNENQLARFRREALGFIFQSFNLLDTLSGRDNIALALAINGVKPSKIPQIVGQAASDLDVESILDKYPYEMSGGQQQRIACARAIVTNPALILADEPTGALDSKSAGMLLESLRIMNEEKRATILMVTHDAFTASHCKRILFIKDGRIFNELVRGIKSRKEFFDEIMQVVSFLGGEKSHAL
ncbi:ABC transporter ATP-binding protein [Faecalicatena orotica]|uniref:Putative ABC transport system ATP-binding protein n=1 Tax=Faecalicatena orotica TaxID=1544 RepID=A0A2Y9BNM6_9FIRM|nr:ABC transporter ATP-binding protein [Faecalicatena orotica]PWJ23414.1 putative ABC transport system ATP-binding protein [Faecalicatena orotica]SSA57672.1 putative ABC transport system ATP-binding protein [Faecalicatena orotica]